MTIINYGYEPCRHLNTFFVAGFQRYDGALVLKDMKPGMNLELDYEFENPYDPNAIALRFNGVKVGYVPKTENSLMALMAYYGHADAFECRIIQVNRKADPWEQVRVAIYVTDER